MIPEALRVKWLRADAVCFDVDSTVSCDEGIDLLAEICGAGAEVAAWTHKAMSGSTTFEEALRARLSIIKPTQQQLKDCLNSYPPAFTPHVVQLIQQLQENQIAVYLVSGGFTQMIQPLADLLQIPATHVFANTILFDSNGHYAGFNETAFTSRSGGKPRALAWIKKEKQHQYMVMIGDGITDLEARPPADLFIAYTGVHERPAVVKDADFSCADFSELLRTP